MKSLVESLFDSDLVSREILLGSVVELEAWECADIEDYSAIGPALDTTFSAELKNKLIKLSKWRKFLSTFESTYDNPFINLDYKQRRNYMGCWQLWVFTWVVMCCHSLKEISIKLNEFMKEISRDIHDEDVFDEDFYIKKIDIIPLEGLSDDMKGMPRLVVIKFKTKGREIVTYMKLKKKD